MFFPALSARRVYRRLNTSKPAPGHKIYPYLLRELPIKISMVGKSAWRDNVFVERLWRTVKYEAVYLQAYASVSEARAGIDRYLSFYNGLRPHSSLGGRTPDQAHFNLPTPEATAA